MLYDDKDYVGFKIATEDRELRKYNRRQEPETCHRLYFEIRCLIAAF